MENRTASQRYKRDEISTSDNHLACPYLRKRLSSHRLRIGFHLIVEKASLSPSLSPPCNHFDSDTISPILGAVLLGGDPMKKVVLKVPTQWSTSCSFFASRPHLGPEGPLFGPCSSCGGASSPPQNPAFFNTESECIGGPCSSCWRGFAPPDPPFC